MADAIASALRAVNLPSNATFGMSLAYASDTDAIAVVQQTLSQSPSPLLGIRQLDP